MGRPWWVAGGSRWLGRRRRLSHGEVRCLLGDQLASPRHGARPARPPARTTGLAKTLLQAQRCLGGQTLHEVPFLISTPPADDVSVNKENGEGVRVLSPSDPEEGGAGQSQQSSLRQCSCPPSPWGEEGAATAQDLPNRVFLTACRKDPRGVGVETPCVCPFRGAGLRSVSQQKSLGLHDPVLGRAVPRCR